MLYLDTAALVKLIRPEPQSEALADWLDAHPGQPWVASALIEVELPRALLRTDPDLLRVVPGLLARINRYEIDATVRAAAAALADPTLRSVDAIHLATAATVFGPCLTHFVTYDHRLHSAARALGLTAIAPV